MSSHGVRRTCKLADQIGQIEARGQLEVTGVVTEVRVVLNGSSVACRVVLEDGTGRLALLFFGRSKIAGLTVGTSLRIWGTAMSDGARFVVWNPRYEFAKPIE